MGGVWRDNTYPGCACDVPSHLYALSFVANPGWTEHFASQKEILQYLNFTVESFQLKNKINFEHKVECLKWDEESQEWQVHTDKGLFKAQFVAAAIGFLSTPNIPSIKNIESFKGKVFHSATWDQDFKAEGKSIAVMGTGASAIQFIPYLQSKAEKLYVFQRTPAWILPRKNYQVSERTKKLFADFPILRKLWRLKIYLQLEFAVLGFMHPGLMKQAQEMATLHLNNSVQDVELRRKLTPNYVIGCKRIMLSDDYYPAVAQKNVEIVCDGVAEMTEDSIVDTQGVKRKVDALIFGTGFKTRNLPFGDAVIGVNGQTLAHAWSGSPKAYFGTTVAGFPNLFVLQGPNTGLGHSSVLYMVEAQLKHILSLLRFMNQKKLSVVEVKQAAQDNFNSDLDKYSKESVWVAGGCQSWYIDETGRNYSLWPKASFKFHKQVSKVNFEDYQFTGAKI
ncbi:4-hydroxyacetophenone monooxygenase [compost metagenome]